MARDNEKPRKAVAAEVLYERSPLRLVRRPDRPNLEIVGYLRGSGPIKKSTGTTSVETAKRELDMLYRELIGGPCICEHCGQPIRDAGVNLIVLIDDYAAAKWPQLATPSRKAMRTKLDYLRRYVAKLGGYVEPKDIDEAWAQGFRLWLRAEPFTKGKASAQHYRLPATIEGALMSLHAVLKFAKLEPEFKVIPLKSLSRSPEHRLDVETMAEIFRYCLEAPDAPDNRRAQAIAQRANLATYMRLAIATWARPEAVLDFSLEPSRRQWARQLSVVHLNPLGRTQTKKHRPSVPVPACVGAWLDAQPKGPLFATRPSESTWQAMTRKLGLPQGGQCGWKVIRRTMATLGRERLGEENWEQGRRMLGHVKETISDTYAAPRAQYLGKALAVTQGIISEIDALCPGAFNSNLPPESGNVISLRA